MKWLMLFILLSCSTGYHSKGFTGGYSEEQVGADVYEVTFNGNAYTSRATVEKYLKRRCAEIAKERGFTHYVIVGKELKGYQKASNTATIKLVNNPGQDLVAYDAEMILKNTAD